MADTVKAYGRILAGDQFEFTLDGIATAAQMDRLIGAIGKQLGIAGPATAGESRLHTMRQRRMEQETRARQANTEAIDDVTEAEKARRKALDRSEKSFDKLESATRALAGGGGVKGALDILGGKASIFAMGLGNIVGSLAGYADKLTEGLQRGISGNIFDLAIAAKVAGVDIGQFTKAIAETGGAFASLGGGATDGAKQFAALVGQVRDATSSVGNLGMTNEQLAIFTAQQTKVAISQGFKGRLAQEQVIKNSRALAEELDTLANRTGKSVLEMAQAAMKLAQDPIVASFVKSAAIGGKNVSAAVQQFGASLRGVFGEAGDAIAADALKSALGGLPLIVTQTGKNMLLGSTALYTELERQANIVKNNGTISAEEQEKLRNIIIQETKARGQELRYLANLEGPIGDSARQMLELAKNAEAYNSDANKQRREEDKRAQAFNSEMRKLQANMQALSIPFLQLINGVDWTIMISALTALVDVVSMALKPIEWLGQLIGFKNLGGSVAGALFGLIAIVGSMFSVYSIYKRVIGEVISALALFGTKLAASGGGGFVGPPTKRAAAAGRVGTAIGVGAGAAAGTGAKAFGMLKSVKGAGVAGAVIGGASTMAAGGSASEAVGSIVGGILGGVVGSIASPGFGSVMGSVIGAQMGEAAAKWMSSSSADELAGAGAESANAIAKQNADQIKLLSSIDSKLGDQVNESMYGNALTSRNNMIAADSVRQMRNLSNYPAG